MEFTYFNQKDATRYGIFLGVILLIFKFNAWFDARKLNSFEFYFLIIFATLYIGAILLNRSTKIKIDENGVSRKGLFGQATTKGKFTRHIT